MRGQAGNFGAHHSQRQLVWEACISSKTLPVASLKGRDPGTNGQVPWVWEGRGTQSGILGTKARTRIVFCKIHDGRSVP